VRFEPVVNCLKSYICYPGGKSRIAGQIVKIFPKHRVYIEPMVGGGSVYFAKEPAEKEVISDADTDLMRFYGALKGGDISRCDLTPNKDRFTATVAKARRGQPLTPCEYLYRRQISFGCKGGTWNPTIVDACRGNEKRCRTKSKNPQDYADRMKHTTVTSGDFGKVSRQYDAPDALHYIDPPYAGTSVEGYAHGHDLQPADVKRVTDTLRGKVVISYNNTPLVRNAFCRDPKYKCRHIKQDYTLNNKGNHMAVTELLITKGIK
jgi:DNA adenine methylase